MQCHNHPKRQALSLCHSCGRDYCAACLNEGKEYYYCKDAACQSAYQAAGGKLISAEIQEAMERFVRGFWLFWWARALVVALVVVVLSWPNLLPPMVILLATIVIGGGTAAWAIDNLKRFSPAWRAIVLVVSVVRLLPELSDALAARVGGLALLIDLAWTVYIFRFLMRPNIRAEFERAAVRPNG